MTRLLPAAFVLFLVGLATYTGSFYAARSVFAAATRCGAPNPPCATYYSGQQGDDLYYSGYSHGIEGSVEYQNVSMWSLTDTLAHWLTMVDYSPFAWAQMGFVEGTDPHGNHWSSPRLYTERDGTLCQSDRFQNWAPPYNPDYPMIYWTGASVPCPSEGGTGYVYWVGRMGGTQLETAYLPAALNGFQAHSEHKNRVYMEPNGTQTFGDTIDLFLYNKNTGYWEQWDTSRQTIEPEGTGYNHNTIAMWTEFTTTSSGW